MRIDDMNDKKESNHAQPRPRTVADPIAPPPPPPADGSAEAVAGYLIELTDYMEGLIPNFRPYEARDARRVATAARFAKALVPEVIATVTAYPPAAAVNTFDVEDARATLVFAAAMKRFARHLSVLLDGVEFTADSELAKAGTQALVTYAWAKKHAKGPDGVGLRFFVVQMTRAIKKAMNRRKPAASTPEPSPATAANVIPDTGDVDDLPEDPRPPLDDPAE